MTLLDRIFVAVRFYTRLPTPASPAAPDFSQIMEAAAVAGALVGTVGGAALVGGGLLHAAPLFASVAAIAAMALVTGALHEDGFADVADGFGGGASRDAKLSIMRDSRLGTYGAIALCLATIARVSALAALIDRSVLVGVGALVFVSALSRVLGLAPMVALRPVRDDGAGAAAGAPTREGAWRAFIIAMAFALGPWLAGVGLLQIVASTIAACVGVLIFTRVTERQIGGYTGDVLGAAQQIAEIAALAVLSFG